MTPHDALFKAIFSEPARAAEAIASAVGPDVARRIDLASLRRVDNSFIDDDLRGLHADLLFTAELVDGAGLVYFHLLFEHQSSDDWSMALRLLRYMLRIWDAHCAAHPQARRLPLIVPVVLAHSDGWRTATSFEALIDLPADARAALLPFAPKFRFALDDLAAAGPAALRRRAVSVQVRLALLALLEGRRAPNLAQLFRDWFDILAEAGVDPLALRALELVIRYLYEVRGADEFDDAITTTVRELRHRPEGTTMETIAQMLERKGRTKGREEGRQEGRQEGREEGRRELLRLMLRRRFGELPPAVDARLAAADLATLDRWAERLVDPGSPADLGTLLGA